MLRQHNTRKKAKIKNFFEKKVLTNATRYVIITSSLRVHSKVNKQEDEKLYNMLVWLNGRAADL